MIVAGSAGGSVVFLDTTTLQPVRASMDLHAAMIWDVAFAMNGTVLATSGGFGAMVKLVDVRSRLLLGSPIEGVEGAFPPQPIAVSPDGKLLAAGSPEHRVRVWDIASGRPVASSPRVVRLLHSVAFSPEGGLLAYADERASVFLWDVSGVQPPRRLHVPGGPATTLAFSPDGRTLASGHMDHTIRLWHPGIDQEVAILSEHEGWVVSVAFADHGNALLSASRDGTLRLWPAAPPDEIPLPAAPRRSPVTSSHPRTRRAHALGRPLPPGRLSRGLSAGALRA